MGKLSKRRCDLLYGEYPGRKKVEGSLAAEPVKPDTRNLCENVVIMLFSCEGLRMTNNSRKSSTYWEVFAITNKISFLTWRISKLLWYQNGRDSEKEATHIVPCSFTHSIQQEKEKLYLRRTLLARPQDSPWAIVKTVETRRDDSCFMCVLGLTVSDFAEILRAFTHFWPHKTKICVFLC